MHEIVKQAESLWNYYWDQGIKADKEYRQSPRWLFDVHEVLSKSKRLVHANAPRRRSLAIWGASQSGKSTFLGTHLDPRPGQKSDGSDGPLSWGVEKGQYALFNKASQTQDEDSVLHINPYNDGLDASGCITRFRVIDKAPEYADFPQEITLLNEHQMLDALAAGYAFEVRGSPALTTESLQQILNSLPSAPAEARLDQRAFQLSSQLFETVETFCDMQLSRYRDLDAAAVADHLFPTRGCPGWLSDPEITLALTRRVLWDDCEWMTALYAAMQNTLDEYAGKRLYCSFSVTSYLLDAKPRPETRTVLMWQTGTEGEKVFFGTDANRGPWRERGDTTEKPTLIDGEHVERIQGVVKEILIPVNKKNLGKDYFDVKDVDVVDIPGVPQQGQTSLGANSLDRQQTRWPRDCVLLYSTLVKRGKTLCIVFGLIRELDLDAMLLMVRQGTGAPIAHPNVLGRPLKYWLSQPEQSNRSPLRIGVSFFAECLTGWLPSDSVTLGWSATFAKPLGLDKDLLCAKVQPFSCPRWQTEVLDRFNGEGECRGSPPLDTKSQKELLNAIRKARDWDRYGLVQHAESANALLREAFNREHGGALGLLRDAASLAISDYSISIAIQQGIAMKLTELVDIALADAPPAWANDLICCLQTLIPDGPTQNTDLPTQRVKAASAIRRLLSVSPGILDDPEPRMSWLADGVRIDPTYVRAQYDRMVAELGTENHVLESILGVPDPADLAVSLLTAVVGDVDEKLISTRFEEVFRDETGQPHRTSWVAWQAAAPEMRQRLAGIVLEWGLWHRLNRPDRQSPSVTGDSSHYWYAVLDPLVRYLQSRYMKRGKQPGDPQLHRIQNSIIAIQEACA